MRLPTSFRPAPLSYTTPTRAEALRECLLRVAFDADPERRELVFRGPSARLGSACHAVLEAAVKGRFDTVSAEDLPALFDHVWQEQIQREEAAARRSPLEQHLGPGQRWPYYALKRARLYRLVSDIVQTRQRSGASVGGGSTATRRDWAEYTYTGFAGRLRGRADRVVEQSGKLTIEDFKTGAILDQPEEGVPEVRMAYRHQLLLYAALEWDAHGTWPQHARLVALTGEHASIAVDPAEALALVHDVLSRLDAYNAAVSAGASVADLCTPSQSVCITCSFKALCPCFWKAASQSWETMHGFACIEGLIVDISSSTSNSSTLEIEVTGGTLQPGRYRLTKVTPARFPDADAIRAGYLIRVVGAQVSQGDGLRDLAPTARTELWWASQEEASLLS